MLRDLKDAWGWISKIIRRIERLESGSMLEHSSITNGRMRFIGGLLLIDSGGTLQVVGHLTGEGDFEWVGPWLFDSPSGGEIRGNVKLSGDFDLLGKMTSAGIRIEGGKIYVGAGTAQIVIDGATGSLTVMGQNPIIFDQNGGVARMRMGASEVRGGDGIGLYPANGVSIITTSLGVRMFGLPTISSASAGGAVPGTIFQDGQGYLRKVV